MRYALIIWFILRFTSKKHIGPKNTVFCFQESHLLHTLFRLVSCCWELASIGKIWSDSIFRTYCSLDTNLTTWQLSVQGSWLANWPNDFQNFKLTCRLLEAPHRHNMSSCRSAKAEEGNPAFLGFAGASLELQEVPASLSLPTMGRGKPLCKTRT